MGEFRDPYHYKKNVETFIACEGMYTGQFVYCGKKAQLAVGNVLPVSELPEGTIVCNVEGKKGDRGVFARSSGNYATIISQTWTRTRRGFGSPRASRRSSPPQSVPWSASSPVAGGLTSPSSRPGAHTTSTRSSGT